MNGLIYLLDKEQYQISKQKKKIYLKANFSTGENTEKVLEVRILAPQQKLARGVSGGGGQEPLRNSADQLSLFKPEGQIMPLTLLPVPPNSKNYLHP